MSPQRYFEFVGGASKKFWSVGCLGNVVTVRFGRIGTEGQTKTKRYPTVVAAMAAADGQLRGKLAKGYRESKPLRKAAAPKTTPSATAVRRGGSGGFAALEEALVPETTITIFTIRRRKMFGAAWEQKVRNATGLARLPPSYLEFAARLRSVGEWIIRRKQKQLPTYLEVYVEPRLFDKSRKLLAKVLALAAKFDQPEMAARGGGLVPFGTDSSHAFFCWDPARTDRRGESPIVLVDNAGDLRVATIAKDLYGLMRNYRQKR